MPHGNTSHRHVLAFTAGALLYFGGTLPVAAQPRAQTVPTPGRNISSVDNADAVLVNPANLGTMPGAELSWTWVRTKSTSWSSARGHALNFATSLPFGLGFGTRLDFVRPPVDSTSGAAGFPLSEPYTWLTTGLSLCGKSQALGLNISHLFVDEAGYDGATTFGLGLTVRSTNWLSLGIVGRNLIESRTSSGTKLFDRQMSLAATVRPTSERSVELGLQADYFHGFGRERLWRGDPWPVRSGWVPKFTAALDIPRVGRLRGDVQVSNPLDEPSYAATATLDLNLGLMTSSFGGIWGSSLGERDGAGWIAGLSVRSWEEQGLDSTSIALQIRVEKTPGTRGHIKLLRTLWQTSREERVKAVLLQLKSSPASSLAHAYEIDDAVKLLRSRGKKVVCHLENAKLRAWVSCAHADRIYVHPAGGLRFAGLAYGQVYLGDALAKLGIRTQFVRIGAHKSAPEQLTGRDGTDVSQQDTRHNLQEVNKQVLALLSDGRHKSVSSLTDTITEGPFTAKEAVERHLVDDYAYDDQLGGLIDDVVGSPADLMKHLPKRPPRDWGQGKRIAVVLIDGNIVDGRSGTIPLLGTKLAGSYTIDQTLGSLRKDSSIAAIVLRIESPGGSSVASDVMWRAVQLTSKTKPVIVSMGTVAASGGYYAAASANKILATPFTVTGSIGIFYGKGDIAKLLAKVGIGHRSTKTTSKADAESMYRPFTPKEITELKGKVKQFYDVFVDRVARGRHMTPAQVDKVARGRVWIGTEAQKLGLVDQVGGLRQALGIAQSMSGLPEDAPLVVLPRRPFSLLRLATGLTSASTENTSSATIRALANGQVTTQVRQLLQAATPFIVYSPYDPLALSEFLVTP